MMQKISLSGCPIRMILGQGDADGTYVIRPERYETVRMKSDEPLCFMAGESPLLTQAAWTLSPRDLSVLDPVSSRFRLERTADGERAILEKAEAVKIGGTFTGGVRFDAKEDEVFFGLGQHERGVLNHRLDTEYLCQNNMKIPMPVLLSTAGYGLLFNMGCPMVYRADASGFQFEFEAADAIEYYIFAAGDLAGLLWHLRQLTGPAALLPRWAFGYIQSKERYKTQAEILETAARFKALSIPLSCIVLDWLSWEEGKWGNKRVDRARFPDLPGMVRALHRQGVAFMVSVWPNINRKAEDHSEMMEAGKLLANLNTYNAFDPEARALFWKQLARELAAAGTDAWWCDSTEPFTPDWNGPAKRPDHERYRMSVETAEQYVDARKANDFALQHARGIYEHQRRENPCRRVVNLTRSGSPSIDRYGVILWSGDIKASWLDMRRQIAEGLNMAMSGAAFWTLDIGAFFVGNDASWRKWSGTPPGQGEAPWFWQGEYPNGADDPGYRELYVRWLQLGTFLPIMRSHGTDTPREPWQFGGVNSPWYRAIVKYIRLRYSLMPAVYSLAADACFHGQPMMRPLALDFHGQKALYEIADQFMLGPSLLICPVMRPMVADAAQRVAVLPRCAGWYAWDGGGLMPGGQTLTLEVPLDTMPVFVKAGAILPLGDAAGAFQSMHVWEGANGDFTLYLDNGEDYAYEQGGYARIAFHWDEAADALTAASREGTYPVPAEMAVVVHRRDGTIEKRTAAIPETSGM